MTTIPLDNIGKGSTHACYVLLLRENLSQISIPIGVQLQNYDILQSISRND
ncbi:MAG: hypothetical protein ACRD47_10400 [Nitrososphaeraceae archaeon]